MADYSTVLDTWDDRAKLENYSLWSWQPVKIISKYPCYALKLPLPHYESLSRMQNWLQCLCGSGVYLMQHTIAVVKTTSNQSVHQSLSWVCCQRPPYRPQLPKMLETTASKALNVGGESKLTVKLDPETRDYWWHSFTAHVVSGSGPVIWCVLSSFWDFDSWCSHVGSRGYTAT